jgi:hypothetical protein
MVTDRKKNSPDDFQLTITISYSRINERAGNHFNDEYSFRLS